MSLAIHDIDLADDFDMLAISQKAAQGGYTTAEEVLTDLSRVIRYVQCANPVFLMKDYDTIFKKYVFHYVKKTDMSSTLGMITLDFENIKPKIKNAWQVFLKYFSYISVKGVLFYNYAEEPNLFQIFHGYKYQELSECKMDFVQPVLDLIHDIICDGNTTLYEYFLNWFAFIVQKPGIKTETAIILQGAQGTGKTWLMKVLSELLAGYSEANITKLNEITGQFNAVMENKMFVVLNEVEDMEQDKRVSFDTLKSIISENSIRINQKNIPVKTAENITNFIFATNNPLPIKIESDDRRYVVSYVSMKRKDDLQFWQEISDIRDTEGFYDSLLTFFLQRDIKRFDVRAIPMTNAKKVIQQLSATGIEKFICDYYTYLTAEKGWLCESARSYKPSKWTQTYFETQIKRYCDRPRLTVDELGRRYVYKLKPEYINKFSQTKYDYQEDPEDKK